MGKRKPNVRAAHVYLQAMSNGGEAFLAVDPGSYNGKPILSYGELYSWKELVLLRDAALAEGMPESESFILVKDPKASPSEG